MTENLANGRSWPRAVGIGIAVSTDSRRNGDTIEDRHLALPQPPSLAFAETVLGRTLPLPVGLLFHAAYVTIWCVVFVRYFPRRNIWTALMLALALWLVILAVFFPLVGWGLGPPNWAKQL